jgi:uncharacterized protein (TIGR02271 family)
MIYRIDTLGSRPCDHVRRTYDTDEEARGLVYEERYADYEVHDRGGERLGRVDALFIDADDRAEYIGVKMGLLGTRSTLIPWAAVTRADEERGRLEVAVDKETASNGPAFEDDQEITPELERRVRGHYGIERAAEGEIRVQRSEEELVAGTREREAGAMRIRKRVRTDRERIEVPVRHEEVSVERVPVSGEATEAQIGEDEVPVTEEEVVTDKRAVAKEEVRLRKDVVEDTEVLEEDVRREEIEVEDDTERGRGI